MEAVVGAKGKSYAKSIIARARILHQSDAFAPAVSAFPAQQSLAEVSQAKAELRAQARSTRRQVIGFSALCLVVILFSLLLPYYGIDAMGYGGRIYSPLDVIDCYWLWFQMNIMPMFDSTLANRIAGLYSEFSSTHPAGMYPLVINRAVVTVIVVGCGMILALSGLLFQTSFGNPLATPSMLGVSDGVTLGCIIFSLTGNDAIADNPTMYLLLVYGLGAVVVAAALLLSRVMSGGARYNVFDMLLLGTVICQLLGGVNGFIQNFVMDEYAWYNFYDVQQAGDALREPIVQVTFAVVFFATFIPALVLRFKLNLISFSDDEGTMMGVRAGLLRAFALVLGSAMQLAAVASIGQVAMVSLAVPFLVRYMMPADFRSQFLGNCLVGTATLLICMAIQHFATVGVVTMPVGTIVSIFIVPFFVWMIALGRGRW